MTKESSIDCFKFLTGALTSITYVLYFVVPFLTEAIMVGVYGPDNHPLVYYVVIINSALINIISFYGGFQLHNYGDYWCNSGTTEEQKEHARDFWCIPIHTRASLFSAGHIILATPIWIFTNFLIVPIWHNDANLPWYCFLIAAIPPISFISGIMIGVSYHLSLRRKEYTKLDEPAKIEHGKI